MDESALIKTCVENPTDETAHLVLADFWDEHGDEPHRARAEWIRLTCRGRKFNHGVRAHGERDWITANVARLWPNLVARCQTRVTGPPRVMPAIEFANRRLVLTIPGFPTKTGRRISVCVHMNVSRAITHAVYIPFNRAATLGPVVARDEPHAQLRIAVPSMMWWNLDARADNYPSITVSNRPFVVRRLSNVWERMVGWQHPDVKYNDGGLHRVYVFPHGVESLARHHVIGHINNAFTEWARETAGLQTRQNVVDTPNTSG